MKYFLHDSTSINQELIVRLFSNYGFEGFGIYYAILERIAFTESPIDKNLAIFTLRLTKKHQKILDFCIEIGLILQKNSELFEENILENAKKYIIRKEKSRERTKKFREKSENADGDNQLINENVTRYDTVTYASCNADVTLVKKSKVKETKVINNKEEDIFSKIEKPKEEKSLEYQNITKELWERWITFKKTQFKDTYKSIDSEQIALNKLISISKNDLKIATEIVNNSIANLYKGLFEIKNQTAQNSQKVDYVPNPDIRNNPDRMKFNHIATKK